MSKNRQDEQKDTAPSVYKQDETIWCSFVEDELKEFNELGAAQDQIHPEHITTPVLLSSRVEVSILPQSEIEKLQAGKRICVLRLPKSKPSGKTIAKRKANKNNKRYRMKGDSIYLTVVAICDPICDEFYVGHVARNLAMKEQPDRKYGVRAAVTRAYVSNGQDEIVKFLSPYHQEEIDKFTNRAQRLFEERGFNPVSYRDYQDEMVATQTLTLDATYEGKGSECQGHTEGEAG